MTDTILWFDQISKDDIPRAGGKGANLGELLRAGMAVPPGFVVTADTYANFLDGAGLRPKIAELLEGADADPTNVQRLQVISQEIKALIATAPVPEDVAAEIAASYEKLGAGPVAVRSSATAEDLPQASFAGQQSTFLNVRGTDHVVDAVRGCWASLFEPHAVSYRVQGGFDHMEASMAVPVQSMIQSERSGVMFTINPVNGDRGQIIIEAVYGLGEAAVSGLVTPDTYTVDKATLAIVKRTVSSQEQQLIGDPEAGGLEANVWRDIAEHRRALPKLADEQIAELAGLGMEVEVHYGRPQDIEWALESGKLYVLQARPVTTV